MIRRSLAEIKARAREELAINPTITVYTFANGVEKRRPANPFAGVRFAMDRLTDASVSITLGMSDFSRQLRKALGGLS